MTRRWFYIATSAGLLLTGAWLASQHACLAAPPGENPSVWNRVVDKAKSIMPRGSETGANRAAADSKVAAAKLAPPAAKRPRTVSEYMAEERP